MVGIPARLRERRKRQDQKSLLRFECDNVDQFSWWFLDLCTKSLKVASEKTLNSCHIVMNTRVTALSVQFFVMSIQFATNCLTKLFVQNVFSTWTTVGCSDDSSSSVYAVCVAAEVNIVEEQQNMW